MIIALNNNPKENSFRAWMLAARPKTLTAAAVPVMLGAALAWRATDGIGFGWWPMALCFLFAFIMQIEANFVNDYFDCVRGNDNDTRLGPQRACQQGWVTLSAMRVAMAVTASLACCAGLPLVLFGGWWLVGVGVACLVFCFLYTTLLAGKGMGDVLVLLFFGLVPCVLTYYVIVPPSLRQPEHLPWLPALACGLVVDTLLIINNYRDIDNDKAVGKITLAVKLGRKYTEALYLYSVPCAIVMMLFAVNWSAVSQAFCFPVFLLHVWTWQVMRSIGHGKALNKVLGMTARNILVFGILSTLLVIFS